MALRPVGGFVGFRLVHEFGPPRESDQVSARFSAPPNTTMRSASGSSMAPCWARFASALPVIVRLAQAPLTSAARTARGDQSPRPRVRIRQRRATVRSFMGGLRDRGERAGPGRAFRGLGSLGRTRVRPLPADGEGFREKIAPSISLESYDQGKPQLRRTHRVEVCMCPTIPRQSRRGVLGMNYLRTIAVLALAAALVGCDKKHSVVGPGVSASWSATAGPTGGSVYAVAANGTTLFAGGNGGVLFRSTDNGAHWTAINTAGTGAIRAFVANGSTNLFAGTDDGVLISHDNGITWADASNGLTTPSVEALTVRGTTVFAATAGGGVSRSTDNGANWSAASVGITTALVIALAVKGDKLYAGTGDGIFLSTNNGVTWSGANVGVVNTFVDALASGGLDVYAGTSGDGVFRTSDDGSTWLAVNNGLTNPFVNAVAVSGTNVYAGTSAGVFHSTDSGAGWSPVNTGLLTLLDRQRRQLEPGQQRHDDAERPGAGGRRRQCLCRHGQRRVPVVQRRHRLDPDQQRPEEHGRLRAQRARQRAVRRHARERGLEAPAEPQHLATTAAETRRLLRGLASSLGARAGAGRAPTPRGRGARSRSSAPWSARRACDRSPWARTPGRSRSRGLRAGPR